MNRKRIVEDEVDRYKREGILQKKWSKTSTLDKLNALCRDIFAGRVKDGCQPVVHYEGLGSELVLSHNYDSVLLDVLFENDLPRLMQRIVGENATLYHIHAITSLPPGYMTSWHSDRYTGRTVHKLLYYPCLDG